MTVPLLFMGGLSEVATEIGVLLDAESEDSTNIELDIHDGAPTGAGYLILGDPVPSIDPPTISSQHVDSIDTEGSIPVMGRRPKYANREITMTVRVYGSTAADLEEKLGTLFAKVGKIHREGGTLTIRSPAGTDRTFDLLPELQTALSLERRYLQRDQCDVALTFKAKPYWRKRETGNISDDFSTDSITDGLWSYDGGSGTLEISSGALHPLDLTAKRLRRVGVTYGDVLVSAKITTGPSGNTASGVFAKRSQANSYLAARIVGGFNVLEIYRSVFGTLTSMETVPFTPSPSTAYFVELITQGNLVVANVYDTAGVLTGVPLETAEFEMTGLVAALLGPLATGSVGIDFDPGHTSESMDSFRAYPNVYRGTSVLVSPEIFGIGGDADALGRILITDRSGFDQWKVLLAIEAPSSSINSVGTTRPLWIEAKDLTPIGTSSDNGFVIVNTDLTPTWQAIMSSEIDGVGHLTHERPLRLWGRMLRPTTNTGEVSVKIQSRRGVSPWTVNDANTTIYPANDREGTYTFVDFGVVYPSEAFSTWEFQVLAKSSIVGDEIQLIDFMFFPDNYTEFEGVLQYENPADFVARDDFDHTPGALNGIVAPLGGIWQSAGDANDFAVISDLLLRAAVSDADINTGRYGFLDGATTANIGVQCDLERTVQGLGVGEFSRYGVLARYTDPSNWLLACIDLDVTVPVGATTYALRVFKRVGGGAPVELCEPRYLTGLEVGVGQAMRIRLVVDDVGRFFVWLFPVGTIPGAPSIRGAHSDLETGGTLDNGNVGVYDAKTGAINVNRTFDNFVAFEPFVDAAVFADGTLEVRHDGASRYNQAMVRLSNIAAHGPHVRFPPSGLENRSMRVIAKLIRNDPETMPNPDFEEAQMQILWTERGLALPVAE